MEKIYLIILLTFVITTSCLSQTTSLGNEVFTKISVPEKVTEQMITQNKSSNWVFTSGSIYYFIGEADGDNATQYNVVIYSYNNETGTFTFVCKDGNGKEYNIQFKNTSPKHVLLQDNHASNSFMCHN